MPKYYHFLILCFRRLNSSISIFSDDIGLPRSEVLAVPVSVLQCIALLGDETITVVVVLVWSRSIASTKSRVFCQLTSLCELLRQRDKTFANEWVKYISKVNTGIKEKDFLFG